MTKEDQKMRVNKSKCDLDLLALPHHSCPFHTLLLLLFIWLRARQIYIFSRFGHFFANFISYRCVRLQKIKISIDTNYLNYCLRKLPFSWLFKWELIKSASLMTRRGIEKVVDYSTRCDALIHYYAMTNIKEPT
jgi:hypothetical protein